MIVWKRSQKKAAFPHCVLYLIENQCLQKRSVAASRLNAMRHASGGRGVTLETLSDWQMSGKSGTKTGNGHISTATAEVEPLETWTPGPRWKGPG